MQSCPAGQAASPAGQPHTLLSAAVGLGLPLTSARASNRHRWPAHSGGMQLCCSLLGTAIDSRQRRAVVGAAAALGVALAAQRAAMLLRRRAGGHARLLRQSSVQAGEGAVLEVTASLAGCAP